MSESIEVQINGQAVTLASGLSIAQWLSETERDPRTVAIELNGEIVPRGRFGERVFVDGDRVEMVQFVQGG